jgi:spore coat polysaccharide biosynthesis protein SpsF
MSEEQGPEASRLEQLWGTSFGDNYVDRNRAAGDKRGPFWMGIARELAPQRVLEVGCNVGGNLRWFTKGLEANRVYGVDINAKAIATIHQDVPGVNAIFSQARSLPFRDRMFDLVFTMGVLIHQPESTLPLVMNEIVRTSSKYVLCGEYFASDTVEVPYRGERGALFKRDYGKIYSELFPELKIVKQGNLKAEDGFDDVTYWVFEKTA